MWYFAGFKKDLLDRLENLEKDLGLYGNFIYKRGGLKNWNILGKIDYLHGKKEH